MLANKVTPRVADGRSGIVGVNWGGCLVRREGREGKGGRPAVTKVFLGGLEGQRSGKHLLWPEGTLQCRGETCCRGVCCFSFSSVWVDLYLGWGAGQRGSITVGVGRHTRSSRRALITSVSLGCRVAISARALISHRTTAGERGWGDAVEARRPSKRKKSSSKCCPPTPFYNLLPIATV